MQKSLTRILVCQLDIDEGSPRLLTQGQLEARRVVNEVFRLDREGYDWNQTKDIVGDRSAHVKNTTQRLVENAVDALERYYTPGHERVNKRVADLPASRFLPAEQTTVVLSESCPGVYHEDDYGHPRQN